MWFKNKYNNYKIEFIEEKMQKLEKDIERLERILKYGQVGYYISYDSQFDKVDFCSVDDVYTNLYRYDIYTIYFYKDNEEYEIKNFNFIKKTKHIIDTNDNKDYIKVQKIKFIDNNVFVTILIDGEIKSYAIDLNSKIFIEISNWKEI